MRTRPIGPPNAKIAIVGEAPGKDEAECGLPFVGASGRLLNGLLRSAGLDRSQCFITNVVLDRPPNNDFQRHYYVGSGTHRMPTPELIEERERLRRELLMVNPNVVLALGNEALLALTNDQCQGISKWRGSVLQTDVGKVIPTYHPALVLRQWSYYPIVEFDIKKLAQEAASPQVQRLERTLLTSPTLAEVEAFCKFCKTQPAVAFDIETIGHRTGRVLVDCVGIATSPSMSMCIPVSHTDGSPIWSVDDEATVWALVSSVLCDPNIRKIAQNGQYDIVVLRHHGVHVANFWLDTMNAFHTLYSELPKGLDFLCSIYTDVPYYKDMVSTDRWRYNALDAAVTFECAEKILDEMKEFEVERFYFEHVHPLLPIYINVHERGVLVDVAKRQEAAKAMEAEIASMQAELNKLVGHPLNVNSPKQMAQWLYDELHLPKQYNKEGRVTANEDALLTLAKKFENPAFKLALEIRERAKLLSTYLKMPLDPDNRARTTYLVCGTETGRLASRASISGTGGNLQNVPHGICRQVFVPDPGCKFIGADLSQAEARIVAYLAGDPRMIEVFESGGDIHKRNASIIFRKAEEAVTPDERYLAKRIVHASNYGLGPRKFAQLVGIREAEARALQAKYFDAFPRIKEWQLYIQQQLRRSRVMVNPFGRKRVFFERWGDDLFREAYAYIPQSTVADVLHRATVQVYARLPQQAELMLNVHDAMVVQCAADIVESVSAIVKEELERPFEITSPMWSNSKRRIFIPAEVKIGDNWDVV